MLYSGHSRSSVRIQTNTTPTLLFTTTRLGSNIRSMPCFKPNVCVFPRLDGTVTVTVFSSSPGGTIRTTRSQLIVGFLVLIVRTDCDTLAKCCFISNRIKKDLTSGVPIMSKVVPYVRTNVMQHIKRMIRSDSRRRCSVSSVRKLEAPLTSY